MFAGNVECEGDDEWWPLAARTTGCVASEGIRASRGTSGDIPVVVVDQAMEALVWAWLGCDYDGSAPGHGEVLDYIAAHLDTVQNHYITNTLATFCRHPASASTGTP